MKIIYSRRIIILITFLFINITGNCQSEFKDWIKSGKKDKYLIPQLDNKPWSSEETDFIKAALIQYENKLDASEHFLKEGHKGILLATDLKSAMRNFNRAWLLDSLNSNVYYYFGHFYLSHFPEDKDAKIAGEFFLHKGLAIDPKNSLILARKGLVFLDEYREDNTLTGKLDDALSYLLKADSISPAIFTTYNLTQCYYLKGDCDNAKKYLNETIEQGGIAYAIVISKTIEYKCSGSETKLPSLDKVWGQRSIPLCWSI